jgi:hypothetical protein
MISKKKPVAPRRAAMHERLARAWYEHPIAVITSIFALLAAAAGASPLILGALNYYQTTADADKHKAHDEQVAAWQSVQMLRMEATVARNRVNDCNVRREQKLSLTPIERAACLQYEQDFGSANTRLADAQRRAMETTKEK